MWTECVRVINCPLYTICFISIIELNVMNVPNIITVLLQSLSSERVSLLLVNFSTSQTHFVT